MRIVEYKRVHRLRDEKKHVKDDKTIMNKFLMPIGDWSCDGHEQCDNFIVETANTLEEIREAHFKLAVNIEEFCKSYGQDYITLSEFENSKPYLSGETILAIEDSKAFEDCSNQQIHISSYTLAMIWTDFLNNSGQGVSLKLLPQDNFESITFCGFDFKGRHIKNIGYGLFT